MTLTESLELFKLDDSTQINEETIKKTYRTYCCKYHKFYPGFEDEKNYIFYDEYYLAPGYLIVNIKNRKVNKFIKIYNTNKNGFPVFALRAYCIELKDNPNEEFNSVEFEFRDIEDDENGLYTCFTNLFNNWKGKRIFSIDTLRHGKNNFRLDWNTKDTKITISKDNYAGTQHPTDYIDILLGDEYSCENYDAIFSFYQELSKKCIKKLSSDKVKKMLLAK